MASKKSKPQKAAKPEKKVSDKTTKTKSDNKSNSFWNFFSPLAAVVFIIPIALAWVIYSQQIQPEREQNLSAKNQQLLEIFKSQLDLHLSNLEQEVESLAESEFVKSQLTEATEPSALAAPRMKTSDIQQLILFPKGNHRPDDTSNPPITFIMINNAFNAARTGETTLEINGDMMYITARVTSAAGDTLGAITAVVQKQQAFENASALIKGSLAIQITQTIDQQESTVFQAPQWSNAQKTTFDEKFHNVFRLKAHWLKQQNSGFLGEYLILIAAIAAGVFNVIALLAIAAIFNRSISQDLEIIRDSMIDLFRGKNPGKERFHLQQIADTYENIYDNLKNSATITGSNTIQQSSELMSDSLFTPQENKAAEPVTTKKSTFSREHYAMDTIEQPTTQAEPKAAAPTADSAAALSPSIFRAYDIRGIYPSELNESVIESIGRAIGSAAIEAGVREVTVARDGRLSGPALIKALRKGLKKSGVIVIDIGMVPTPVLYYAAKKLTQGTGVMLTGSHNPSNYNGLKIMIAGKTLYGDTIQDLYTRIKEDNLAKGTGQVLEKEVMSEYQADVIGDIVLSKALKIAVDCGNGVTGVMLPQLFEQLGTEASGLYTEVDGSFPNHSPDPSQPKNMKKLIEVVKEQGADLGLAFDGDGDRVGVITPSGKMVYADRLMMLFAEHVLAANPGQDIIYDVKCSSDLTKVIRNAGGRPIMWKTGHSLIKAKLKETNAPLAGEMSGHIFFNDRWNGFDDAIYAAARLLEILSSTTENLDELLDKYPEKVSTPELHVEVTDESKFQIMKDLATKGQFGNGTINEIDGVRVDFEKGWGLLRASNTTPVLVARFEAESEEVIQMIQGMFRENLQAVAPGVKIDF